MVAVLEDSLTDPLGASSKRGFDCSLLEIEKLVVHHVYVKSDGGEAPLPKYATALTELGPEAKDALQRRIVAAIGSRSSAIETTLRDQGDGSFFSFFPGLLEADGEKFVSISSGLADHLRRAQTSTSAPAGVLAVLKGVVGVQSAKFIAAIKAELHDGFAESDQSGGLDIKYVERLLLTPSQKLYKVGFAVEREAGNSDPLDSATFRYFLFDQLLTSVETRKAARYFYSSFLGMTLDKSARRLTQEFFELTTRFLESNIKDPEVVVQAKEALRVEMRSNSPIINPTEFAKAHIDEELQVKYRSWLDSNHFPKQAIVKDTAYVKNKLRARKFVFDSGVKITAPSDSDASVVSLVGADGNFTTVKIAGMLKSRE